MDGGCSLRKVFKPRIGSSLHARLKGSGQGFGVAIPQLARNEATKCNPKFAPNSVHGQSGARRISALRMFVQDRHGKFLAEQWIELVRAGAIYAQYAQ